MGFFPPASHFTLLAPIGAAGPLVSLTKEQGADPLAVT